MKKKISVIGVGKLGLCLALNLEKNGYELICVDSSVDYVNQLQNKTFYSEEPFVNEYLKHAKNITFTLNLQESLKSDVIFIVVQTPSTPNWKYDSGIIDKICEDLLKFGKQINRKDIIINCTTFPGYCEELHKKLESYNYFVSYNPEFIAQGTIIEDQINADMILIGQADNYAGDLIEKIHRSFCLNGRVYKMSRTEAELTKLSLNCFLTTKIAYANMVGDICLSLNGDPDKVLGAIGEDSRVGKKYLKYGFGFGGPCFPRDNRALAKCAEELGLNAFISKATDASNNEHLNFQIKNYIKNNPDKNDPVLMDFVTYKKESTLLTESQQLKFAEQLYNLGYKIIIKDNRQEVLKNLNFKVN
jgi:UDPglucose 6-dehydrogenase